MILIIVKLSENLLDVANIVTMIISLINEKNIALFSVNDNKEWIEKSYLIVLLNTLVAMAASTVLVEKSRSLLLYPHGPTNLLDVHYFKNEI